MRKQEVIVRIVYLPRAKTSIRPVPPITRSIASLSFLRKLADSVEHGMLDSRHRHQQICQLTALFSLDGQPPISTLKLTY